MPRMTLPLASYFCFAIRIVPEYEPLLDIPHQSQRFNQKHSRYLFYGTVLQTFENYSGLPRDFEKAFGSSMI